MFGVLSNCVIVFDLVYIYFTNLSKSYFFYMCQDLYKEDCPYSF